MTGFDYLRARYYDSQAGTFLTEDSYPGQQTDPSGHKKNPFGGVIAAMQSAVKAAKMAMMSVTVAATMMATTQAVKTTTAYVGVIVNPSRYSEEQRRRIEAEYQRLRFNQISRGLRETTNLARNWTKALSETIRHFCDPKTQKGKDDGKKKPVNWNFGGAGGVASWDGTSSTINGLQTNGQRAYTPKKHKLTNGDAQVIAIIVGLGVGAYGGLPAGFATYNGVRAGLTSHVEGDPWYVSVAVGGLAAYTGYQFGKFTQQILNTRQYTTTNLNNKIDITPSNNHSTTTVNPGPYGGQPHSSIDIVDKDTGEILTRRFYDQNGRAYRDVDFTHHGNVGIHPEAPHEHFWKYDSNGKVIGR